jgi:hypothetical protein
MAKPTGAPAAPKHLRTQTRKWFDTVVNDYELDGHHIRLLTLAAESWDQAQTARESVTARPFSIASANPRSGQRSVSCKMPGFPSRALSVSLHSMASTVPRRRGCLERLTMDPDGNAGSQAEG